MIQVEATGVVSKLGSGKPTLPSYSRNVTYPFTYLRLLVES